MASDPSDLVASGYDAVYASWNRSPTLRRIWRDLATGQAYPDEFHHISFLTAEELAWMGEELRLGPDGVLVDLACGAGGPGLWVARESGARLVGVDLSPVALLRAAELAATVGVGTRAEFHRSSFAATGLDAASADAVMSVDALQYAPDKARAFVETARVVRRGGRLVFVAFELDADHVAGTPLWGVDPVADYRPLVEQAGFEVKQYAETPGWRERVKATFEAVVSERAILEAELVTDAAMVLTMEASMTLDQHPYRRRVLAVASRG